MSIYEKSTIGWPDNQITFNDSSTDPYYRILTRLPQKFQIRSQDIPIPFQSGISDFMTLIGETIYVLKGKMYPSDEFAYDRGRQALAAVSSLDLEQTDPFSNDEGYAPYTWGDALNATNSKQIFLKALYCNIPEDTRQGYAQPFEIICKIKDPTIYGGALKTASTQTSNTSVTTGSAIYPFTYPIVFGSTNFAVSATANNIGNIASYPNAITVYGPVNNPKVVNTKTGEYIQVNVNLSSSDVLIIQYGVDNRTVTLNGVNSAHSVDSNSTFFKVQPGINVIQLSGSSVGTGAYATMTYYDAWPLA